MQFLVQPSYEERDPDHSKSRHVKRHDALVHHEQRVQNQDAQVVQVPLLLAEPPVPESDEFDDAFEEVEAEEGELDVGDEFCVCAVVVYEDEQEHDVGDGDEEDVQDEVAMLAHPGEIE